jgi:hypothetical protein
MKNIIAYLLLVVFAPLELLANGTEALEVKPAGAELKTSSRVIHLSNSRLQKYLIGNQSIFKIKPKDPRFDKSGRLSPQFERSLRVKAGTFTLGNTAEEKTVYEESDVFTASCTAQGEQHCHGVAYWRPDYTYTFYTPTSNPECNNITIDNPKFWVCQMAAGHLANQNQGKYEICKFSIDEVSRTGRANWRFQRATKDTVEIFMEARGNGLLDGKRNWVEVAIRRVTMIEETATQAERDAVGCSMQPQGVGQGGSGNSGTEEYGCASSPTGGPGTRFCRDYQWNNGIKKYGLPYPCGICMKSYQ